MRIAKVNRVSIYLLKRHLQAINYTAETCTYLLTYLLT